MKGPHIPYSCTVYAKPLYTIKEPFSWYTVLNQPEYALFHQKQPGSHLKDDLVQDVKPLRTTRKTYQDEIKEKMRKKIVARRNPFAQLNDDLMDEDADLLRERAKIYMARREWDRALKNLNRTLYQWGAKGPEKYDPSDPPNKQSLYLRCKIRLLLCENENALSDALAILADLKHSDPMYTKGLACQGDALFQMGRFEHSLVIYHRGHRIRNGTEDDFRVGIQKATASINNCLKNVKRKIKVDINVEDTCSSKFVSRESFVFPHDSNESKHLSKRVAKLKATSVASSLSQLSAQKRKQFAPHSAPFKDDIIGLTKIVSQLKEEKNQSEVEKLTEETLDYLKSRETLWKNQAQKTFSQHHVVDFSPENLARFYADNEQAPFIF